MVYQGWTVSYDALQFAVYMGFSEIYLLGVDCSYRRGYQSDGTIVENEMEQDYFTAAYYDEFEYEDRKDLSLTAVANPVFAMRQAFQKAKEVCGEKGIIIKNATRGGKLEIFERVALETLLGTV